MNLLTKEPRVETRPWPRSHEYELRLFDGEGGEPTLDEVIASAWEGLVARHPVACPVCGAAMEPEPGGAAAGSCGACGTRLS